MPPRIAGLVDRALAARHLEGYKLAPVLCVGGARHRLAFSDAGEPGGEWIARVARAWPEAPVAEFFAAVPAAERRMVDTDGEHAVFYLDELCGAGAAGELPVMCRALATDGERTWLSRHASCPFDRLPRGLREAAERLAPTGGFWGLRWRGAEPVALLWVSESRHRGDFAEVAATVDSLPGGPAWNACRAVAARGGMVAYPDGVELWGGGRADVTVGFARRKAAS